MRIAEFCFIKVAHSLGTRFNPNTWSSIGEHISSKMDQKYQSKSDEWKASEPFYAGILTDIQAISRKHRNPCLHSLKREYGDGEALYMLTVIEELARHVAAENLREQEHEPRIQ